MKFALSIFGLAAGLSLASVANATVTYTFASTTVNNNAIFASGSSSATYSGSAGTITVYADQVVNNTGVFDTPGNNSENGLFTVNAGANGTGIAPYNPNDYPGFGSTTSTTDLEEQKGIVDGATGATSDDNIILLKLTGFAANSTLSLLLQAGPTNDSFTVYTSTGATPTRLGGTGMAEYNSTPIAVGGGAAALGGTEPTTPQVTGLTIAGLGPSTTGWIAIQADCQYLLLDTVGVGTTATPEPRFYGILLAALLGLAGIAYKRRAQVNA
jgi:hypothetical protein